MRVVIPLAGTRGDIQPAVALGLELQSRGHSVALGVPPNLVDFAIRASLTATTFGPDVEKLYSSERGQKALAAGSTFKLMPMVARQMSEYADRMDGELIALAEGADVIVSTQLTEDRSQSIAEAHGIPQITLHTFPSRRNGTYAFAGSVDHTKNLPAFVNKSTWVVAENIRRAGFGHYVNRLRKRLGLRKTYRTIESALAAANVPEVQIYDAALVPGLAEEWGPARPFAGFLPLSRGTREAIGELAGEHDDIVAWARSGPAPIYFGFGSMPIRDTQAIATFVSEVCARLGRRALISAGWSDLRASAEGTPDHVRVVGAFAHDVVLPHCAAAVHHGGIGTTFESLRAGLPTLVCSVSFDQPFWGAQVTRLGIGAHIPFPKLRDRLEAVLPQVLDETTRERTKAFAGRLGASETATARVADIIETQAG